MLNIVSLFAHWFPWIVCWGMRKFWMKYDCPRCEDSPTKTNWSLNREGTNADQDSEKDISIIEKSGDRNDEAGKSTRTRKETAKCWARNIEEWHARIASGNRPRTNRSLSPRDLLSWNPITIRSAALCLEYNGYWLSAWFCSSRKTGRRVTGHFLSLSLSLFLGP